MRLYPVPDQSDLADANCARRSGLCAGLAKRTFDLAIASLILAACSWVMLYFWWVIRMSGGPALYGHQRVGRHGVAFTCYKFRTMVGDAGAVLDAHLAANAEAAAEWQRDFKLRHDPRVTRIGGFLRRTSLDELPQLWNVIKGEMSLVGPRPVVAAELDRYGPFLRCYLDARPGVTGLWQVSGRSDTGYARRIELDVWYARNGNSWTDMAILVRTLKTVFVRQGAY